MPFLNRLRVDIWTAGEFVVVDPLDFTAASGANYIVPKGFITNFASVPKVVQLLPGFDVNGDSRMPATLHDWLYASHLELRSVCDDLLREALISVGVPRLLADQFYMGVRVGGESFYNARANGIIKQFDFVPDSYWSTPT